jgi:Domain of unknown function (DUF1330)
MKQTTKLALTLLTGFALGGGAIGELKAQGNKPPAYVFAEVEVTDPAGFQQYVAKLAPTLTPYHGKIVVRGKPDTKEAAAPNGVSASWPSTIWKTRRAGTARRLTERSFRCANTQPKRIFCSSSKVCRNRLSPERFGTTLRVAVGGFGAIGKVVARRERIGGQYVRCK